MGKIDYRIYVVSESGPELLHLKEFDINRNVTETKVPRPQLFFFFFNSLVMEISSLWKKYCSKNPFDKPRPDLT